jgi:hypothetical protein
LSKGSFVRTGRSVVARVLAVLLGATLLFGGTALVAAEPRTGPAHEAWTLIELRFGYQDGLRYDIHRFLGKVLSFCPCTAGLSREQYRKASFHEPDTGSP